MIKKLKPEEELVLAIARDIVYKKNTSIQRLNINGDINWVRFKDILSYHDIAPFAYLALKDLSSLISKDVIDVLAATYYHSLKRICYLEDQFLNIYETFENKNILLVPIKGVALLEDLYAACPIRPSVDIDILIKEEDVDKAVSAMEELGFKKELEGLKEAYWKDKQYHFVFIQKGRDKFPLIVELHWDLDYPRKTGKLLPQKFNRLRNFQINKRQIKLLSVEDTFFALALHQRRFGNALSLKDVCDMAILLNKYSSSFDWDYVLKESKRSRNCSVIYFALSQIQFLFELNLAPEEVWNDLKLTKWKKRLIQHFIENNTFLDNQRLEIKNLYLKAHFLLYDGLLEPIDYIWHIPQEQFAKFYDLKPYDKKTNLLYRNRLLFMPFKTIMNFKKGRLAY